MENINDIEFLKKMLKEKEELIEDYKKGYKFFSEDLSNSYKENKELRKELKMYSDIVHEIYLLAILNCHDNKTICNEIFKIIDINKEREDM